MESHRRLPHRYPPNRWLFFTWHLHGSLPHSQSPPPAKVSAGQVFVWIDRYLDRSQHGPQFLHQEAVVKLVIAALLSGARLGHYRLGLFVVMANHLMRPSHVSSCVVGPPKLKLANLTGVLAVSHASPAKASL